MTPAERDIALDPMPFFITAPGATDGLFVAVTVTLVLILLGFGAFYFTIQNIPDRMAAGTSKTQLQIVGLLGLLSLFTMNNIYWVAALLIAAIRFPDLVTPVKVIARSLARIAARKGN